VRVYRLDVGASAWAFVSGSVGFVQRIADDNDRITASCDDGLYRWDGADWVLIDDTFVSSTTGDLTRTWSAAIDPADRVWAAQRDGVREALPGGGFAHRVPPQPPGNNFTNLAVDGGRVYVTTINEGVGRLDANGWRHWLPGVCTAGCDTTFSSPEFTFALFVDRAGEKWVAAWESGIERFDDAQSPPAFTHYWNTQLPDSAAHTRGATGVADGQGGVWIGLDTPDFGTVAPLGLDYYRDGVFIRNYRPENTPSMTGAKIKALAVDASDRLFIGYSGQGLAFFDFGTPGNVPEQVGSTDNLDIQALEVHGDDVWALTTIGLIRYARLAPGATAQRDTFDLPAAAQNVANNPLAVAADGTVYCGTTAGMRVLHPDRSVTDYTRANSPLADDDVRAIAVDPASGDVWIATAAGLHRFDPDWVDPGEGELPSLHVRVRPNPAELTGIGVPLRIDGDATSYQGEIYDLNGRRVRRFACDNGDVFWDGRDDDGRLVRPGIFFVLARAGGRTAVARVALIR
jgi:hypothetical protein